LPRNFSSSPYERAGHPIHLIMSPDGKIHFFLHRFIIKEKAAKYDTWILKMDCTSIWSQKGVADFG
jgi:hypothetical protein